MEDNIRILLLGDPGVGKSSLMSTYISHHFSQNVAKLIADSCVPSILDPQRGTTTLVDSSALDGDEEVRRMKIKVAQSIILLYDVKRLHTLQNVLSKWLPEIVDCLSSSRTPSVVLCGNKMDLPDCEIASPEELKLLEDIFDAFPFLLSLYRISTRSENVSSVFFHCEQSVVYPIGPLFNVAEQKLTYDCSMAFTRVFRCFDVDGDGLLSDAELNALHIAGFNFPLKSEEMAALKKQLVKQSGGGRAPCLRDQRITVDGLKCMFQKFAESAQSQPLWIILRKFGYDDNFNVLLPDEITSPLSDGHPVDAICRAELSQHAITFLSRLASSIIKSNKVSSSVSSSSAGFTDLLLDHLKDVFSPISADIIHPWSTLLDEELQWVDEDLEHERPVGCSAITFAWRKAARWSLSGWIAQWQMVASVRPLIAQSLLYRLGYVNKPDLGIVLKDEVARSATPPCVFRAVVLGTDEASKHLFVRGFCSGYFGSAGDSAEVSTSPQVINAGGMESSVALVGARSRGLTEHQSTDPTTLVVVAVPNSISREWLDLQHSAVDVYFVLLTANSFPSTTPQDLLSTTVSWIKSLTIQDLGVKSIKCLLTEEFLSLLSHSSSIDDNVLELLSAQVDGLEVHIVNLSNEETLYQLAEPLFESLVANTSSRWRSQAPETSARPQLVNETSLSAPASWASSGWQWGLVGGIAIGVIGFVLGRADKQGDWTQMFRDMKSNSILMLQRAVSFVSFNIFLHNKKL